MKKYWDKFRGIFRINKKLLLILLVITVIGIIAGSLLVTVLSDADKNLTTQYLNDYFTTIKTNKIDYVSVFTNTAISNTIFVLGIWLLGISIIGIPIMVVLYFAKTFILGFSIASLFSVYKLKGSIYSLLYIFPHHIINLLIFMIVMIYAFAFSTKLTHALFKKTSLDVKPMMNKYLLVLATAIVVVLLTSLVETFVMPNLMGFMLEILK